MAVLNPPHSGAFIQEVYLAPNEIRCRARVQVGRCRADIAPRIEWREWRGSRVALRLAKALGRSPESRLSPE